jgi:hypothetical protein
MQLLGAAAAAKNESCQLWEDRDGAEGQLQSSIACREQQGQQCQELVYVAVPLAKGLHDAWRPVQTLPSHTCKAFAAGQVLQSEHT